MFARLGQFCAKRPWTVIAAWAVLAAALHLSAPAWSNVALDGDFDQLPADTTTARGARLNAEAFPDDRAKSQIVVVFAHAEKSLSADDRRLAIATARALESLPGMPLVDEAWTEATPIIGPILRSGSGRATRIVLRLTNDLMAVDNMRVLAEVQRVVNERRREAAAGLAVGVTGSAAIGGDMLAAAAESLRNTDRTTILLVAIALAAIYRSPWLVIVPLAAIGVAAIASLDLLSLLARVTRDHPALWPDVRVFTTTRIFVVVLLFGAGTDFCLFLIARFRELRGEGVEQREAVAQSLDRVGSAITASALTTIVGLAMMGFAQFGKFSYSGPAIAVSLAIALAVCLTLAPALLATWIGAQVVGPATTTSPGLTPGKWDRWWAAVADGVLHRPAAVLAVSVLVAAPLAWYGARSPVTYDIFSELSPRSVSRQGTALLLQHFPAGEVGPLAVLARRPVGGLESDEGRLMIAELTKRLYDIDGVDKVRSLYRPTGEPPGATSVFSTQGLAALTAANSPLAKETYVTALPGGRGDVTRLYVTLDDSPFSAAAAETSGRIERRLAALSGDVASPWHGAQFELLGPTSGIRDLQRVTQADLWRIQILVAAAVFAVILVLLRRPAVCAFLIVTVVVGYLVTLGIVRLLLEAAYGAEYPGLDWKAPVFLFVILVAVGQDYNIYLVTRVFEEQRRLGPLEGLRRAVAQTGGIITSCGVIMAATFGSMISGSLRGMVELGVALALGILLDTFVVRTIVVPAFLAILARREERSMDKSGPPVIDRGLSAAE